MPIIPEKDRKTIAETFSKELKEKVTVQLFTQRPLGLYLPGQQECQTCKDTQALLEEVVSLSDKLELQVFDRRDSDEPFRQHGIEVVPTIVLKRSEAEKSGVRFLGLPAGYEFATLIGDIVDVSRGETDLSLETREAIEKVDQPVHIQVYVTPT